jgi:plasmid stability protein
MIDIVIRDVPDDVVAALDTRANRMGLSRTEYIRRRLTQDAQSGRVPVTTEDLCRFGESFHVLGDDGMMREAWT